MGTSFRCFEVFTDLSVWTDEVSDGVLSYVVFATVPLSQQSNSNGVDFIDGAVSKLEELHKL